MEISLLIFYENRQSLRAKSQKVFRKPENLAKLRNVNYVAKFLFYNIQIGNLLRSLDRVGRALSFWLEGHSLQDMSLTSCIIA